MMDDEKLMVDSISIHDIVKMYREKCKECEELRTEMKGILALAKFGAWCFDAHRDEQACDIDGWDLEKAAIKFGLLEAVDVTEPCKRGVDGYCWCESYHGDFPCQCLRATPLAELPGSEK